MSSFRVLAMVATLLGPTVARADEPGDSVRAKSPVMVATGLGMMTVGTVATGVGIGFVTLYATQITTVAFECPGCRSVTVPRNDTYLVGGIFAIVTGMLAILGGIPLVYFGAKHERRTGVWLTAGGFVGAF